MDRATADRIEAEWSQRDLQGGRVGLATLGDAEFSGAVRADGGWVYLLNGRVVGTVGGTLERLADATSQVAYETPHPALPLLFAMQAQDPEPEARYFTDDTPLEEVHETLSSGSFTGYVELSENVHSGDYYIVYYGGRALHAAFVGAAEQLLTDQEAYERAIDEVGIFEVKAVDLDVTEVPEPPDDATGGAAMGAAASQAADDASSDDEPATSADAAGDTAEPDSETVAAAGSSAGEESGAPAESGTPESAGAASDSEAAAGEAAVDPDPAESDEPSTGTAATDAASESDTTAGTSKPAEQSSGQPASEAGTDGDTGRDGRPTTAESAESTPSAGAPAGPDSEPSPQDARPDASDTIEPTDPEPDIESEADHVEDEAAWRERRTVPALDPSRSSVERQQGEPPQQSASGGDQHAASTTIDSDSEPATTDRDATHVESLEAELEDLRERLAALDEERTDLREERDELLAERDRLQARVRELEAASDGATTGPNDRSPADVLEDTDLFVRYDSKSDTTLEDVHDGEGSRESLGANIRLESHTRFDADAVTVDGAGFEDFLRGTLGYRFAAWLVEQFVFEIRETGNDAVLRDLFDALPAIDRVEFDGAVTTRNEDGDEERLAFDLIFRDQMGQPLLVADLDEGRDPTGGDRIDDLLARSSELVQAQGSLTGAFLVTASFFHNEVHESVKDATKTGFLDRDSRQSFVKTARNDGYHVCLVEAREDAFHLSRPDL